MLDKDYKYNQMMNIKKITNPNKIYLLSQICACSERINSIVFKLIGYVFCFRVIFLEDDDVAAVRDGHLTIHRVKRTFDESVNREIITLKMEIQQIMKGNFSSFMQKV